MVENTTSPYSTDNNTSDHNQQTKQQDNKITLSTYRPATTMMTEMRTTPLNVQPSLEYFITDMRQTLANQIGTNQCIVLNTTALDRKRKYPDTLLTTDSTTTLESISEENDYKQKYFDLLGRYENLKTKYSVLAKEHDLCKRTVPVCPPETENWLRTVLAKVELLKEGGGPIGKIPLSPHSLRSCVRDTPSNTARQIVRRLFSKEDLANMSASKIDNELMSDIISFVRSKHPLHPIETSKIKAAISNLCVQARRELKGASASSIQQQTNNTNDHKLLPSLSSSNTSYISSDISANNTVTVKYE